MVLMCFPSMIFVPTQKCFTYFITQAYLTCTVYNQEVKPHASPVHRVVLCCIGRCSFLPFCSLALETRAKSAKYPKPGNFLIFSLVPACLRSLPRPSLALSPRLK